MVILVSAISCTGKTLMSQKLLEKYKMPYLSIDHLKMGFYRGDENCGFTPMDSNEVIGEKLWPILKGIIMTAVENDQNLIIEGCYLLPHLVKDFEQEYLNKIIPVFFGFSTKYIEENFTTGIIEHRSAIETRDNPEDRPMSQFIEEHNDFGEKCMENDIEYFQIDKDYEKEIAEVYDYIEDRMSKTK